MATGNERLQSGCLVMRSTTTVIELAWSPQSARFYF